MLVFKRGTTERKCEMGRQDGDVKRKANKYGRKKEKNKGTKGINKRKKEDQGVIHERCNSQLNSNGVLRC
jgi:hypothetical protein